MKFPKYTRKEKKAFAEVLKNATNVKFKTKDELFKGKDTYISICKDCGDVNYHEVQLEDLGDKIKKLQCPKCHKWYKIRPSPIILDDGN
jgi:uncharacterized protein YbaR (Trm112 family)